MPYTKFTYGLAGGQKMKKMRIQMLKECDGMLIKEKQWKALCYIVKVN